MGKLQPITDQPLKVYASPSGKLKPVDTPLVVSGPKYVAPTPVVSTWDKIKGFGHDAAGVIFHAKGLPNVAHTLNNFTSAAGKGIVNTLFAPGVAGGDLDFQQQIKNAGGVDAYNAGAIHNFETGGRTDKASNLGATAGESLPYFIPGVNAAITGNTAGVKLGNISSQTGIANNKDAAAKVFGEAGLNLIPGLPLEKVTGGLGNLPKAIANNAIRGLENVVRGQGSSLIENGQVDLSQVPEQFGTGFGLGAGLNLKETTSAVKHPLQLPTREVSPIAQAVVDNPVSNTQLSPLKAPQERLQQLNDKASGVTLTDPTTGKKTQLPKQALSFNELQERKNLEAKAKSTQSVQDYIKEQTAKQQTAREAENPTSFKAKVTALQKKLKSGFIDSQAAIEDTLAGAEQKGGFNVVPSNDIRLQQANVRRSDQLATQFIHDNGLADVVKQAPDLDELNQYLIARHASDLQDQEVTTGRDSEKDAQLLHELGPTYEPLAQKVTEYSQKSLDYAVQSGLISQDTANYLKEKYPNYVPIDRIFSESEQELQRPPNGTGKTAMASQGSQNVVRKLKGSEREISNPIETLFSRTQEMFQQGERNKSAQMLASYRNLPDNPFGITPLRTEENVTKRINLYEQTGELRPVQRKLQRLLTTRAKWQRNLESSINALNQKGLYLSLKGTGEEKVSPSIQSKVTVKQNKPGGFTETDTGDRFFVQTGKTSTSVSQKDAKPTNREFKQIVNNIVNLPRSEIEAIKSKIATRENHLGTVLDQMADMSDSLELVKSQRNQLLDEARVLRDASSKGLATFSVMKNGVKEIYATNPDVVDAAKNLNKQQLGLVGQILGSAVRVFKVGTTGLRPSFIIANLAKDQVTAAINSDHALNTSVANPLVFLKGFAAAIGKNDLFQEMQRAGGGGTSLDLYRNAAPETVAQVRSTRDRSSSIMYTVTHPKALFRAAEEAVNVTEQMTRLNQYKGTKDVLIEQGRTEKDATLLAAKAARENTVDFYKSGSYGQVLNAVIPYLNAGIQGSRTLVSTLRRNPAGAGAKLALTVFSPIMMATLYNLSDPDRKAVYDDLQPYEKEGNIIIVPPGATKDPNTGKYNVIKIPLSQEVANLANIVRRGIEGAHGGDPETIGEVASNLFQAGTSFGTNPRQILSTVTPQVLKGPLEVASNTDLFTGNKIIPDSLKDLPPEMQTRDSTPVLAKTIGSALGISPLVINKLTSDYFGGLGTDILAEKNPVTSVTDRFNQASGGALEDKNFAEIDKSVQQGAITQAKSKQSLTEGAQQYANASTTQRTAIAKSLISSGALTKSNLTTFKTLIQQNIGGSDATLSSSEKYLKSQSADVRATYLRTAFQKLPKGARRTDYLKQLVAKKIVTPDVYRKILNPSLISSYGQ